MSINQFGKTSQVELLIQANSQKTILSHVNFTAPFKIMKPFYDHNNNFSLMIMSSSAGVMAGDCQEISVTVEENASAYIYSQSYEKIHKMLEGIGSRNTRLEVKKGALLQFRPQPTIPYADSNFVSKTEIFLEDISSKLIYSDILSCGRVAMGEVFQYQQYVSKLSIFSSGELIYHDNTKFKPLQMNVQGFCMQERFTHQSTLLFVHFSFSEVQFQRIDALLEDMTQGQGGYTKTGNGDLIFRFLASSGDYLEKIHKKIIDNLEVI